MTELLTAAQMRAIETAAIESGEVTGLELMERAGRGVVDAVFEEWPDLAQAPHRAVVLCGPGNNGGDGFVVARLLKEWGWDVDVFLYGDPEKLPPDAKVNCERWSALGETRSAGEVKNDSFLYDIVTPETALFVDALFGTGLIRPLQLKTPGNPDEDEDPNELYDSELAHWLSVPSFEGLRTVSVDLPSGVCSDSGKPLGGAMQAQLCATFHGPKIGHFLDGGPELCGKVQVVDIGLPRTATLAISPEFRPSLPEPLQRFCFLSNAAGNACLTFKDVSAHKYSHGHALILSGGPGRGGAGRLAARGALRIGAGLVTVGCPPAALQENAARLDALMLKPLGSDEDLALLLDGDARLNALCLGPGLGTGARERQLVAAALAAKRATVLDADALTLIAGDEGLFAALHQKCVLTPHAGEFACLFPDIAKKLYAPAETGPACSKVDATREAAARAGCVILFKGPDTVIANPNGHAAINSAHYDRAAPWLATAGSGDVLAGFIAGLLARGFAPMPAAETAAWLHVESALAFGPGLIAEDLPEMLPKVFRALGL
ncbi:MAG: NAD(P)H-hydrate dehydratase [Rhodobacter sp.]|nr:NAD(P)H-hydrate dehydratase [Rhodobacter sp.]